MSKGKDQAIGLSATCSDIEIIIHSDKEIYKVWRKAPGADEWGYPLVQREIGTEFIDLNIEPGIAYEYKFQDLNGATGYILAGSKIPLVDSRGKLILVIEGTHVVQLVDELERFQKDLAGDGYEIVTLFASRTFSPEQVKALIKAEWEKDPANVKTVILFGSIPIFMAGPINYDGHGFTLVAADGFYADMTGYWGNSPGVFPAHLDLIVGRIDFSGLTCFSNKTPSRSELDLLRNWLNRNHAWRTGQWPVTPRGAIRDGFSGTDFSRDFSSNGFRNIHQLCRDGIEEIPDGKFFSTATVKDYLIVHLCGGGQLVSMAGVGDSNDFATNDIQVPFVMLLGSLMLGRWDVESAFVRSALASGDDEKGCMVAFGAGAPHVWLHPCGLGEPVGSAWLKSVNNFEIFPPTGNPESPAGGYTPAESDGIPPCLARVHEAFFGDPTLGLYPVKPVTDLMGVMQRSLLRLSWTFEDASVLSCHVYRSSNANGPFTRLSDELITTNEFTVTDHFAGLHYMVRAVKLIETPSGSFYAASTGAMWSDTKTPPMPPTPGTSMSKSTFITADTTNKGNGGTLYGLDGSMMPGGIHRPPLYASATIDALPYEWSEPGNDIRALQIQIGSDKRIASAWNHAVGFEVEIKSDTLPHRLALYFLDWDDLKRSQKVEIMDGNAVISSQRVDNFSGGIWMVWEFRGSVKIRLTKLAGPNAVLSAIMFSPAGTTPIPMPTPGATRSLEVLAGPTPNGPWTSRGTVEVEATAETEFYRLRIL